MSLVWEENFGSGTLTDTTAVRAFADIVAGNRYVLALGAVEFIVNVILQHPGQGRTKAGEMGSPVPLMNIVGVGKNDFLVRIVPLHGHLDGNPFLHLAGVEIDHFVDHRAGFVEVVHKSPQSAFVAEGFLLAAAFVNQADGDAGVEGRRVRAIFWPECRTGTRCC